MRIPRAPPSMEPLAEAGLSLCISSNGKLFSLSMVGATIQSALQADYIGRRCAICHGTAIATGGDFRFSRLRLVVHRWWGTEGRMIYWVRYTGK